MLKETVAQKYKEFEKEDTKPFTSRIPLHLISLGNAYTAFSIYAISGAPALERVYTSPEGLIPTALITTASIAMYARSLIQQRSLNKIAVDIAEVEGRTPSKVKHHEKHRTRTVIKCSRALSPGYFRTRDFQSYMVAVIEIAHKTAETVTSKRPAEDQVVSSIPQTTDYIRQEHKQEVDSMMSTIRELTLPRWQTFIKKSVKTITNANDALNALAPQEAKK